MTVVGEAVLNIREHILINRVKHFVNDRSSALDIGIGYLERYYSLIAFCAYLNDQRHAKSYCPTFGEWIRRHRDIWNNLSNFRRQTNKMHFFRPVEDLGALSTRQKSKGLTVTALSPILKPQEDFPDYYIVKSRTGSVLGPHTILKIDHWGPTKVRTIIRGAPNLRSIPNTKIYTVAQPTLPALQSIIGMIHENLSAEERIIWINVREEPVIYIDDEPYVLRDRYATLRNIKSYSGITAERLEDMERRLKEDIHSEASLYNKRLFVHCESSSGYVTPSWLSLDKEGDVLTMRDIFTNLMDAFPSLEYHRLPVTAEEPLEPLHCDQLMDIILREKSIFKLVLVFNCQMGASRSTTCAVLAYLIVNWSKSFSQKPFFLRGSLSRPTTPHGVAEREMHYRLIHSILRVIGSECKVMVDEAINAASDVVNLRESIEMHRESAGSTSDPNEQRKAIKKGIVALKRYALLILFQGYLNSIHTSSSLSLDLEVSDTSPGVFPKETFSQWLQRHQEFYTLLEELDRKNSIDVLSEESLLVPEQGPALSSEVIDVVRNRRGQVLASMTILKFDHFPGCQKTSLVERIEGAPNFRQVGLDDQASVYGMAMPTKNGFINSLERICRPVLWCCLREEPVIYINGRPYVLRIVKDPVANLEMTGIISERVEQMEARLKMDIIRELHKFNGKLLIHEEDAATGNIIAVWESVFSDDIETTAEIMSKIKTEGHHLVEFHRVPMYRPILLQYHYCLIV